MKRSTTTTDEIVKLLREKNVQVRQACLFGQCKAAVRKQGDGYLILVEESLAFDAMVNAIQHEMCHILLGHLDNDIKSAATKEREVLRMLKSYKKIQSYSVG